MASPHRTFFEVLAEAFPEGASPAYLDSVVSHGDHLLRVLQTLNRPGQCPVVYGPPGIGKTTIAWQVEMIARGNVEMLESSRASKYALLRDFAFETFRFKCSGASIGGSSSALLQLVARDLAGKVEELTPQPALKATEREVSVSLGLSPKLDLKNKYQRVIEQGSEHIEQQVILAATDITLRSGQPVLIVIDDLEQLEDTVHLTDLLKSVSESSPDDIRFVLAGSASRVKELLREYSQLSRIAVPIQITPAPAPMLVDIVRRGLARLRAHELPYVVDEQLVSTVVTVADGIPAVAVQLIRDALLSAEQNDSMNVTRAHVDRALLTYVRMLQDGA